MQRLITVPEAATLLNLKKNRVFELVRKGFFPAGIVLRFGRQIRFNEERLNLWIEAGGAVGEKTIDLDRVSSVPTAGTTREVKIDE